MFVFIWRDFWLLLYCWCYVLQMATFLSTIQTLYMTLHCFILYWIFFLIAFCFPCSMLCQCYWKEEKKKKNKGWSWQVLGVISDALIKSWQALEAGMKMGQVHVGSIVPEPVYRTRIWSFEPNEHTCIRIKDLNKIKNKKKGWTNTAISGMKLMDTRAWTQIKNESRYETHNPFSQFGSFGYSGPIFVCVRGVFFLMLFI